MYRYVCAVTEFVLSIGKVSMVGDNILTLYRAVNCLHLPVPSWVMCLSNRGMHGTLGVCT